MFVRHHQQTADELVRVCRPGGTIGLISWTPTGFVGRMFATMKPHLPAPPPGVSPPPLWGSTDYVRTLLGDQVTDLSAERRSLRVDLFTDGAEPLTGGSQNVVVRLRVDGHPMVLRRPPAHPRPNSNKTMQREIAVLQTLVGTAVPHLGSSPAARISMCSAWCST